MPENAGKTRTKRKVKKVKKNAKHVLGAQLGRTDKYNGASQLISPFKKEGPGTQEPPEDKALLVWESIIDNEKYKNHIFISLPKEMLTTVEATWLLSGKDITQSFKMKSMCEDTVVSFFMNCLMKDDETLGPEYSGYRLFLDPKISVSENFLCNVAFIFSLIFSVHL